VSSASGARRFLRREDLLPAILAALSITLGIAVFSFFLSPSGQVGYDEGYEAAGVERLIDGRGLPYVDVVAIRGPFLYWTQAIFHLLTGRFQWTGTRVMALAACATTGTAGFLGAWAAGWPLAGAIAAALNVYVLATLSPPGSGVAIHGEPVAIAYISTAFCLMSFGLYRARTPRQRTVLLALGGAVLAMGILTKQTLIVCGLPMLVWVVARGSVAAGEAEGGGPRVRAVLRGWALPFLAGGVALVASVLLRYALAGELGTFFYWSSGVGSKIYMEPYQGRVAKMVLAWFMGEQWAIIATVLAGTVALASICGRATDASWRGLLTGLRESAFETVVGLTTVSLIFAAAVPLRMWGHYFVPVWIFAGMTLGILIERFAVRGAASPRAAQAVVVLIVGTLLVVAGGNRLNQLRNERKAGGWRGSRPNAVCAEIDRIAGPGRDQVFIWGLAGDLYVTCQRRCASMYTHTTLIVGIVPPFWDEPTEKRIPKGSREKLLSELTANAPKVIIDHPMSSVAGTAMADIPVFARFLSERYCRLHDMRDRDKTLTLYGRKDLPVCQQRGP